MTMQFIRRMLAWALMVVPSLSLAVAAAAQTTTASTSTTTPGVPNTGAGGDLMTNLLLLGVAGLAIIAGAGYLAYQRANNVSH